MKTTTTANEADKQPDAGDTRSPYVSFFEHLASYGALSAAFRYNDDGLLLFFMDVLGRLERELNSLAAAKRQNAPEAMQSEHRRRTRVLSPDADSSVIRAAFRDAQEQYTTDDPRSGHIQLFERLAQCGAIRAALTCGDRRLAQKALDAISEYEREWRFHPPCRSAQPFTAAA